MRFDVEPISYADAGTHLGEAGRGLHSAMTTLMGSLAATGAMAGDDSGGRAFAAGYDEAARAVVAAGCSLPAAFGTFAQVVHQAAANHAQAEAASAKKPVPPQAPRPVVEHTPTQTPPSAFGGTGGQPSWWEYVAEHVGGMVWPDADTGRLRAAGQAYEHAATAVDVWASSTAAARSALGAQDSPEIVTAVAHVDELDTARKDLADALRTLGRQCSAYADEVDRKHEEIWDTVKDTVRDLAITEGIVILLSVVSAGTSVVAGGAAAALELAAAGRRVVVLLRALEAIARTATTVVKGLSLTAGAIERIGLKFAAGGIRTAPAAAAGGARAVGEGTGAASGASARAARGEAAAEARSADDITTCGDPVDVATGQVVLDLVDLELDGVLPLVLRRYYRSGFRHGGLFGPHWGSTLDEHVEISDGGAALVRWDTSVLRYPDAGAQPSLPLAGRHRWPLRLVDERTAVVNDPVEGLTSTFVGDGERRDLVRVEDRAGRWIVIERDGEGLPTRVTHYGGYEVAVGVQGGLLSSLDVVGPQGPTRVRTFEHEQGELARAWRGERDLPVALRLERGPDELLAAWVDSTGVRYEYVYDELGRCTWQGTQGGIMQYAYRYDQDPTTGRRTTRVVDSTYNERRFDIGAHLDVVRETDQLGAVVEHVHDAWYRRVETRNGAGEVTQWAYDDDSRLVSVTDPEGRTTLVERDEHGSAVVVVDAAGGRTLREVDDAGDLTLFVDHSGAATTWERSSGGRTVVVTDPTGVRTVVECDAAGLPVLVVDALGGRTMLVRDAFGRVVEEVDPLGYATHLAYDVDGHLVRRTAADGSVQEWEHDGEGNVVREVDAAGRVRSYEYGPFDVLTARVEADGSRVELEYDTERRLVLVRNELGAQWRYRRDAAGRVVEEIDYDGRVTRYAHDAAGRVVQVTNPLGQVTDLGYDRVGDLVRQDVDGLVTELTYDPLGALVRAHAPGSRLERVVDAVGRVVAETVNGATTRWTYDAAGRLLERVLPSGVRSTWSHDAAGCRSGVDLGGHEVAFDLDAAGRVVRQRFAGGVVASEYDVLGRLSRRSVDAADPMADWSVDYGYALSGELTRARDSRAGEREYVLDVLGRIERVQGGSTESYGYDRAGNVTSARWGADGGRGAAEGERSYEGLAIRSAGRDRFEVDAAGRVTRRRRALLSGGVKDWVFDWSADDRLREVCTPDGSTWRYSYDVLGRRTAKECVEGGRVVERVEFVWDGPVLVGQTRSVGGVVTATAWVHEGWAPVAQLRGSTPVEGALEQAWVDAQFAAIVTDLVGQPVRVVGGDGGVLWSGLPSVWGVVAGVNSSVMPLRLPGQYADDESGLFYNLFRHYDPTTARYVSSDPLGLVPGPNPYAYPVNPTIEIDPLGLAPCRPISSRVARREAMRRAGIPTSMQPVRQARTPAGMTYEYEVAEVGGGRTVKVVSDQTTDRVAGHGPHWEAGTAKPGGRRDPFGRLRVRNGKAKVDYG